MSVYCPVLCGGPYDVHVLTVEAPEPPPVLRFPAEPLVTISGEPSICAPPRSPDGPVVYRCTGTRNVFESPIYRYEPTA